MKKQLIVRSIMILMTLVGCARPTKVMNQQSEKVLNLKNQSSGIYQQKDVVVGADKMQLLGTFEKYDLPSKLQSAAIGAVVGNLSLIENHTKYESEYKGAAKPIETKVKKETEIPVHLIEYQGRLALAIKRNVEGAGISDGSEPIAVRSEFKDYCPKISIVDFKITEDFPRKSNSWLQLDALLKDFAFCDPNGICVLAVRVNSCVSLYGDIFNTKCEKMNRWLSVPIGGNEKMPLMAVCIEDPKNGPTKNETLTNTTKPTSALIRLPKSESGELDVLQFEL